MLGLLGPFLSSPLAQCTRCVVGGGGLLGFNVHRKDRVAVSFSSSRNRVQFAEQ